MAEKLRKKEDNPLDKPNKDGNVWPGQLCPAFTPRENAAMIECWYCKYADFHLNQPKALEVGVCCFPKEVTCYNSAK